MAAVHEWQVRWFIATEQQDRDTTGKGVIQQLLFGAMYW